MSTIYEKAARDIGLQAQRTSHITSQEANIVAVEFDASERATVVAVLDMHPQNMDEVLAIGPDHLLALNNAKGREILMLLALDGGVIGYTKFLTMKVADHG